MARYTLVSVSVVMPFLIQTLLSNLPNASIALTNLAFTSSSMTTLSSQRATKFSGIVHAVRSLPFGDDVQLSFLVLIVWLK